MYCVYRELFIDEETSKIAPSIQPYIPYGSISDNLYKDVEEANLLAESCKDKLVEDLQVSNIKIKDIIFSDLNQNRYYYSIILENYDRPLFIYVHKFLEGDN